jgi:oxygen-independent coproporphyrinogen-3 oxidase
MWPYHPDLLDTPVPRYTSYPTAAEFGPVGDDFHRQGFASLEEDMVLSLYVHIPYCHIICWYCGCNTGRASRRQRLTAYLDALHMEIDRAADYLNARHPVSQIAFGGGSPNAIEPVDFVRLLDHILTRFDTPDPRLSVELDPRSLTDEWIAVVGHTAVGNVSLGVQSFDPEIQTAIGRLQPYDLIAKSVADLRGAGVGSVNFDLLYGLPGQTLDHLQETIDKALELDPDRIALFGYAHLPDRIPRQRKIDSSALPDAQTRFYMAALGYEKLLSAGYLPVGFDHFAKPGDALGRAVEAGTVHRNFQGFSDDKSDAVIGLGASAISRFPDRLVQNEKNAGRYRMMAAAGRLPGSLGVRIPAADKLRSTAIEQLLCTGRTVVAQELLTPEALAKLDLFRARDLVDIEGDQLVITNKGRPYSRSIASLFDSYRAETTGQFSSAI